MTIKSSLTITAHTLRALVEPVMSSASDDYQLPVINAVRIESRGQWLTATATDRFRLAMKRVAADDEEGWPEFYALLSVRSIKNILTLFKPVRGVDPEITLTIDGDRLSAEASGGLVDDVARAAATYFLVDGEYPNVDRILAKALAARPAPIEAGFNFKFLSSFAAADPRGAGLRVKCGGAGQPLLVLGENFLAALMPRNSAPAASVDDWADMLRPSKKGGSSMTADTIRLAPAQEAASRRLLENSALADCTVEQDGVVTRRWPNLYSGEQLLWNVLAWLNGADTLPTDDELAARLDPHNHAAAREAVEAGWRA